LDSHLDKGVPQGFIPLPGLGFAPLEASAVNHNFDDSEDDR
jgi:hypothetical protein